MSLTGYFTKKSEDANAAERAANLEDWEVAVKVHEFYERVEDYDPVLKAHCRR